jgi:hypothetical protein
MGLRSSLLSILIPNGSPQQHTPNRGGNSLSENALSVNLPAQRTFGLCGGCEPASLQLGNPA